MQLRTRGITGICGVALAGLAVGAGSATAAPFASPMALGDGATGAGAQVAVAERGEAVAVWTRAAGGTTAVQVATRAAAGAWSAPATLSADGFASAPHVATDGRGGALVVWAALRDGAWVVQGAQRPAGGAWSAPVTLSAPVDDPPLARVAMNAAGDAVVAWGDEWRVEGREDPVQAVVRSRDGRFGEVQTLAPAHDGAARPRVAVGATGEAVAVWIRSGGTGGAAAAAALGPAGSPARAWSAPATLSAPELDVRAVDVAVDDAGAATVLLAGVSGAELPVEVATRPAGGAFSRPARIGAGGAAAVEELHVDAAGRGAAVAGWTTLDAEGRPQPRVVARGADGRWSAPRALAPAAVLDELALTDDGGAVAGLSARVAGGTQPVVALRASGAAAWTTQPLSAPVADVPGRWGPVRGLAGVRVGAAGRAATVATWSTLGAQGAWTVRAAGGRVASDVR